jgi:hypothetical protein
MHQVNNQREEKIVELLLEQNGGIDSKDADGRTVGKGYGATVRLLLEI